MSNKVRKGRLTGKLLSGRYKLEALLESGQSGEIYEAADLSGDGRVTVAVPGGNPLQEPERLERLSREVQGLFEPHHVNLGAITSQHLTAESRRNGEVPYLVFAEQDGTPLDEHIRKEGPLKQEMASFILLQVIAALKALHGHGSCHGGLSAARVRVRPEHLLHDDYARLHLPVVSGAMLSAAIALLEDSETLTEEEIARLPHAPPEALLDEEPTPAGDIYSAGALLYLCLTGQPPLPEDVQDAPPAEIKDALLFDGPPPITDLSPDLPRDLIQVVTRCLAKDVEERPGSLEELRGVLSRHAPEPAVTGCGEQEQPSKAAGREEAAPAPPISPVPTPVAFSLGDAQRQAALRRPPQPAPSATPPLPPAADIQLDNFDTIAMPAQPRMQEPEHETRGEDQPDDASEHPEPDDFDTIAMPSPFKKEAPPPTPPEKVPQSSDPPQPDLQPAGAQTEDFSTVLLSMEELEQESSSSPAASTPDLEEPEADLDPNDATFHSMELSLEDLKKMKVEDGES